MAANESKSSGDQRLNFKFFGQPFNNRPLLLNFRDRTPKRTDREAIELLDFYKRMETH
jgi:hypothetical protein